jgi:Co/Zn/Cd efflux system component
MDILFTILKKVLLFMAKAVVLALLCAYTQVQKWEALRQSPLVRQEQMVVIAVVVLADQQVLIPPGRDLQLLV